MHLSFPNPNFSFKNYIIYVHIYAIIMLMYIKCVHVNKNAGVCPSVYLCHGGQHLGVSLFLLPPLVQGLNSSSQACVASTFTA